MPEHEVQEGECLLTIAARYGFGDLTPIWAHEANAALRARKNPYALAPGEKVFVPEKVPGRRRLRAVNTKDDPPVAFRLKPAPIALRLFVQNAQGAALGNCRYQVLLDGQTLDGTTDGEGLVEQPLGADIAEATLHVWAPGEERPFSWRLTIGQLLPVTEALGVQARLQNLGYGVPDDELGKGLDQPRTKSALAAFQEAAGLEPKDGVLNEATRQKLFEVHDGPGDDLA
ncbi:MAG: peptidoglycan-binding protein [Planctomycetes bacterium]|nr:peptidoglycan-binding protein [Planctomycetota bacterium]